MSSLIPDFSALVEWAQSKNIFHLAAELKMEIETIKAELASKSAIVVDFEQLKADVEANKSKLQIVEDVRVLLRDSGLVEDVIVLLRDSGPIILPLLQQAGVAIPSSLLTLMQSAPAPEPNPEPVVIVPPTPEPAPVVPSPEPTPVETEESSSSSSSGNAQ